MRISAATLLLLSVGLTGCGFTPSSTPLSSSSGVAIQGVVHGGQQPVVGAHVYLFAANSIQYGGSGIPPTLLNASVSLLNNVSGSTTLDTSGGPTNGDYYVITGPGGTFSITGDYTCAANSQVYLYVLGGNPGAGVNTAIGELAILGNCPSADNFATTVPYVIVNEITTVASAYAFAGFATDATHVSSGSSALAKVGIANAFANAANLVDVAAGIARTTTPAGNATVPQSTINTLANIIAACVNASASASACTALLNNVSTGSVIASAPTETATAAIYIAQNPGVNVGPLYGNPAPTSPFVPTLSTQPNDFTIGLHFTGGGISGPVGIAIDATGAAWITNDPSTSGYSLTRISPSGSFLSGTTGYIEQDIHSPSGIALDDYGNVWVTNIYTSEVTELLSTAAYLVNTDITGGGLTYPSAVAIDASGNVWIANSNPGISDGYSLTVSKFSNNGIGVSGSYGYAGGGLRNFCQGIAIDGSGSAWVTSYSGSSDASVATNSRITKVSSAGVSLFGTDGLYGDGVENPIGVALDSSGNAWIANHAANTVTELSNSGTSLSGASGWPGGGQNGPSGIAIDGAGNVWVTNISGNSVTELSYLGSPLSGSTGYKGGSINNAQQIAIDGSGNAWITNYSDPGYSFGGSITELVGVATPVITPIAAGLPSTPTSDGHSNLGTRP